MFSSRSLRICYNIGSRSLLRRASPPALLYRPVQPSLIKPYSSSLPTVAQPSFWAALIPKPLRRKGGASSRKKAKKSKEWNPATFYIVIFLLIGSMSVQMISLRNESEAFDRRADAKIGLLREIIQRVQNGEEVDVEGLLGTGDKVKEQEWEEVLQEIEREESLLKQYSAKKSPLTVASELSRAESERQAVKISTSNEKSTKTRTNAPSGFY